MKKVLLILSILFLSFVNVAAKEKLNVYVFTKGDSEYCINALKYLEELNEEDFAGALNIIEYEVYDAQWKPNEVYVEIKDLVASKLGDTVQGYPYIVVGNNYSLNAFDETYQEELKSGIKQALENPTYDIVQEAINERNASHSKDGIIIVGIVTAIAIGSTLLVVFARRHNQN